MRKILLLLIISLFVSACSNPQNEIEKLERIKKIGNTNPTLAIKMLDSVSTEMMSKSTYVKMKYELLNIRLHDKAFILAKSDTTIRAVVEYFTKHGNNLEIQEALYYAGSVYRDLDDTPRSLQYFLESKIRCETTEAYDTLLFRNTLSNLNCLYYQVQDYKNALACAEKEYELSKQLNDINASTIIHEATSLARLNKTSSAKTKLLEALEYSHKSDQNYYPKEIYSLLYHFSKWRMKTQAQQCYSLSKKKNIKPDFADAKLSIAEYFLLMENADSAIYYFRSVLNMNENHEGKYSANRLLVNLYNQSGNKKLAAFYADKFIRICDTLDLGKRQIQAATVNNKFKYYQDEKRERELENRERQYKLTALGITVAATIVILLLTIVILYKRNARIRILLEKDKILEKANKSIRELKSDIARKDDELNNLHKNLERTDEKLKDVKRKIEDAESELCFKEQLLSEKIKQNNTFIKLLHQSELEEKASDVIEATRNAADGKYKMTTENWKKLYKAVDELHPHFSEMLAEKLGRITEPELQFCYLMKIGLSNTQIKNLTELPRTTVWRWTKKYEWIVTEFNRESK